MDAQLLVTGDEIVRGAIVDTNSAWLLERLAARGVRVRRVVAVGDDRDDLLTAMREATGRASLVVVTGGLGPTSDDLTAECAAEVAGVPLERHEPTVQRLVALWGRRKRPMPLGVDKQALVPAGSEVLQNDEGTAPGFRLRIGRADCFFFAGVPREFRHLCDTHLLPWLDARSKEALLTTTLRCVGIAESELDEKLSPVAEKHGVRLGLRAIYPESWASLTLATTDRAAGEAKLGAAVEDALEAVGRHCYSTTDETLAAATGRLLRERGDTLAVAESCTGGLLGAEITSVAGSSAYFRGGVLAYANEEKERALGVKRTTLEAHGAVSEAVALEMAIGARTRLGTTWALSITGVAGPGGGTAEKPVGTVWTGLAGPAGAKARLLRCLRLDRESIRRQSVSHALDLLRRALLEVGG